MRVISYPRDFIDNSVQIEGQAEDYRQYYNEHLDHLILIAEYNGTATQAKLLKINNERVTFWIKEPQTTPQGGGR